MISVSPRARRDASCPDCRPVTQGAHHRATPVCTAPTRPRLLLLSHAPVASRPSRPRHRLTRLISRPAPKPHLSPTSSVRADTLISPAPARRPPPLPAPVPLPAPARRPCPLPAPASRSRSRFPLPLPLPAPASRSRARFPLALPHLSAPRRLARLARPDALALPANSRDCWYAPCPDAAQVLRRGMPHSCRPKNASATNPSSLICGVVAPGSVIGGRNTPDQGYFDPQSRAP